VLALLSMIASSMRGAIIDSRRLESEYGTTCCPNLSDDLVKSLKQRAAKNNRSAEQEHRKFWKRHCADRDVAAWRPFSVDAERW